MTSSSPAGQRWGAARRSGMTVLGKVAVPKPLNLPSQRLENQGLDPNVEIVPKGTLSWGSKSSSNAWGSSSLSPRTDSGTGSPSHPSNRPSSGGTGTRPSTAGSDIAHEPATNAWGSNSRPSSASGLLTSNQTSFAPLRPRSAETRPGSSQLSRFAEPFSENSVAWGAAGTAEKLGVAPVKNDGFSLTSGDFPSLGSEKECSGKGTGSQEHDSYGRPSSSSGRSGATTEKSENTVEGEVSINANARSGNVNSWRRDNHAYGEDGARHNMEERQADARGPPPYPNASFPHQQFDAWRGPPINNHPGGVWYRGPPGGPPYGPPVAPGGYPMEPFPYFPPQVPPNALPTQPVPGPGAGPRGNHPKNGDMYRPPMHEAYVRPGMPIRPGFYPGPMPYEGYYGPPIGYCNPNERDIPFMGMPSCPYGYNKHSGQGPIDPGSAHARSSGYDPPSKSPTPEEVESGCSHETQGPYKVLLKHQEGRGAKDERNWDDTVTNRVSNIEKGQQQRPSSSENNWRVDHGKERHMDTRRGVAGSEVSHMFHHRGGDSSDTVRSKLPEKMANTEVPADIHAKKEEKGIFTSPEVWPAQGDSSLIQKIEGLNAKARTSDGRHNISSISSREEQRNKFHVGNAENLRSKVSTGNARTIQATGITDIASQGLDDSAINKSHEWAAVSGTAISRRSTQGVQSRADNHSKGRVSNEENDGWRKKPSVSDSCDAISATNLQSSSNVRVHDSSNNEVVEKSGPHPQGSSEGESAPPVSDTSDSQRAMMRELAKQRVIQRQREEEERARDQRAKALAKLEELNRRTQTATEDATNKMEAASGSTIPDKREESGTPSDPLLASSSAFVSSHDELSSVGENSSSGVENSKDLSPETRKTTVKEAMPVKEDVSSAQSENVPHVHDGVASKQRHMGYKQKQNLVMEKNITKKSTSSSTTEAVDITPSLEVAANEVASSCNTNLTATSSLTTEASTHSRRKHSRNGKKKHKVEEASSVGALGLVVSKGTNLADSSVESGKPMVSEPELDSGPIQSLKDFSETNHSTEQHTGLPSEETRGRGNNQWKSQHPRRAQRNPQIIKPVEKFHGSEAVVWAPVRAHNKTEATDEASQKVVAESVPASVKSGFHAQNNPRNKRSEMERYVPKPIAKEMAQQGVSHLATAPVASENVVQKEDRELQVTESSKPSSPSTGKPGSASDSSNGDGRQSKHGKGHGSWRQRGQAELTRNQASGDRQSSNSSQHVQKPVEHQLHHSTLENIVSSMREQPEHYDEWGASDGWQIFPEPDSTAPVGRDQGMNRGRRHGFRGHKGIGYNHDESKRPNSGEGSNNGNKHKGIGYNHDDSKRPNSGEASKNDNKAYMQHSIPEINQGDLPGASKENHGSVDRSSYHWQPKSQTSAAPNQRGERSSGAQSTRVEAARDDKKDFTPLAEHHYSSDKITTGEAPTAECQEPNTEQKMTSVKRQPHSQNQGPVDPSEHASANVDARIEQHSASGFRKIGNHNRYGRGHGHESHGDWGSSGQENWHQRGPSNRGRQRQHSHYEYQPVGAHNNDKAGDSGQPKESSHNSGPRYREKGPSHSRHGGEKFYHRQRGNVQGDGGYE